METILYAYQIEPGSDETLWFTATQEECQYVALAQRLKMQKDMAGSEYLGAMAVYRFVFRHLRPQDFLSILNGEKGLAEVAAVDRRLVAIVAD